MNEVFDDVDVARLRRRRTVKWTLYGPEVLAAWVAEMDFDVAPVVRAALLEAVDREDFGYVEADLTELTTACAEFFAAEHGWVVPPTRIFAVADVLAGIATALDVFVAPGAQVVVPTPAYPPFFEVVELTGREVVTAPLATVGGRATLDLDRVESALRAGAGAVLLCNPHNPTGRVFTTEELRELAALVDRYGARVIADEVHAPLVYGPGRHVPYTTVSDAAAEHTVTVTSASKAFNIAGLKSRADRHDEPRRRDAVAGPAPAAGAGSGAARDRRVRGGVPRRPAVAGRSPHVSRRQPPSLGELLAEHVPGVVGAVPEATYLAWLDCSTLGTDDPARFFLEQARVALSDGPPFGPGCDQYVRLNFATSRALLERIVGAMGDAVRPLRA